MFEQDFDNLFESEKEEFKRITNYLLSKTFVIRNVFDKQSERMIVSPEFQFIERNQDLFEKYLSFGGWKLNKDQVDGIYMIESEFGYNKARFDSFQTYVLLALMIIYEETSPITTLGNSVITKTYDVIEKMTILGLINKRPSKEIIKQAFRRLEQHNVILRLNTNQDVEVLKIMILPSIHQIVSYDKLKELCDYIPSFIKEKYEGKESED